MALHGRLEILRTPTRRAHGPDAVARCSWTCLSPAQWLSELRRRYPTCDRRRKYPRFPKLTHGDRRRGKCLIRGRTIVGNGSVANEARRRPFVAAFVDGRLWIGTNRLGALSCVPKKHALANHLRWGDASVSPLLQCR